MYQRYLKNTEPELDLDFSISYWEPYLSKLKFADDYFYMQEIESPFMNIIFKAKENTKHLFPDVVHVDGTSRVQTVSEKDNKKFYNLINEFYKITNCPILINTSLNVNGPIAESPNDAFNFFLESDVKCIVLNNWIIKLKK